MLITGLFIIKGVFLWIFYSSQGWRPLLVGLISSIACYSILTVLYHETDINFWLVLVLVMVLDVFIYNFLINKSIAKSIVASFFLNLLAMIFFIIGNG